jgi:serine/threonine-protein kinase
MLSADRFSLFMRYNHNEYRLNKVPIGDGGQAEVFRAEHRESGAVVPLKRRKSGVQEAADRMRREIEIQSSITHPHVMPILDFDRDDWQWFTMPLAVKTLDTFDLPIDSASLQTILRDAASGLRAAHERGFVHRDIKPSNLLLLENGHWVVADWGLVRRPHGQTTVRHTLLGVFLGTEGFAPPEAHDDAHSATAAWDSYSLGRVAAWAVTAKWPAPNIDLIAPEPWRRFVRLLTNPDPTRRPQDMSEILKLLEKIETPLPIASGIPAALLDAAKHGDDQATIEVLKAAEDNPDDEEFFIDDLAELTGEGLDVFVTQFPDRARNLLALMDKHFFKIDWGNRDFNYMNVPLHWIQRVAQAAANAGHLDLLEDACDALFNQEPPRDRYLQKDRTCGWLESLEGPPAARVAQVLRDHLDAARYYGNLRNARDPQIRAVMREARNAE